MIEVERIDYRDMLMALGILDHAAKRVKADANRRIVDASALADDATARLLRGYTDREPGNRELRAWGYSEVETEHGAGLIRCGFDPYAPRRDLGRILMRLAGVLHGYDVQSVEIATSVPAIWFSTENNDGLDATLASVRGAGSLSAASSDLAPADRFMQHFVVFLAEAGGANAARDLADRARVSRPDSHARLVLVEDDLLVLVIARAVAVGVDPIETNASLERFSVGITSVMRAE
jgi:hypothetical protein